ncbi:hypothetical protein Q9966_001898 [Columba livia]|nr:hypothetical protein Q9966_001898 [Columba livia]
MPQQSLSSVASHGLEMIRHPLTNSSCRALFRSVGLPVRSVDFTRGTDNITVRQGDTAILSLSQAAVTQAIANLARQAARGYLHCSPIVHSQPVSDSCFLVSISLPQINSSLAYPSDFKHTEKLPLGAWQPVNDMELRSGEEEGTAERIRRLRQDYGVKMEEKKEREKRNSERKEKKMKCSGCDSGKEGKYTDYQRR